MTKDDIYIDKFTNLSVASNFITDYLLLYLKSTILVNDCVLLGFQKCIGILILKAITKRMNLESILESLLLK